MAERDLLEHLLPLVLALGGQQLESFWFPTQRVLLRIS